MTLPICFERFDWRLSCLYKHGQSPLNLRRRKIQYEQCYLMFSRTLQLLIETLNVNKNDQIKWYGQGRRRRLLWISFQLTVLLKLFIHMTFVKSLWKSELAELFRIPCSCRRSLVVIEGCENFLSLNLYVIRMSLSTVFVLLHLDSRTLSL